MSGHEHDGRFETDLLRRRLVALEQRTDVLEDRQDVLEAVRAFPRPQGSVPVLPAPRPRPRRPQDAVGHEFGEPHRAPMPERSAAPERPVPPRGPASAPEAADDQAPGIAAHATGRSRLAADRSARAKNSVAAHPLLTSDLLGGRVLAWVGAVAVLVGVLFFLALAVSHGWIGREARTVMAALASLALLAGGVWLQERRGHTDAALAAVGSAVASLFATLVVASRVYALLPSVLGIALAVGVGALTATLAVRWARPPVAALGIVGALLSPVLVGASPGLASIGILWAASAAAVGVLLWQRWDWLAVAVLVCGVPQWGAWLLFDSPGPAAELITPSAFGALGLVAAIGYDVRARMQQPRRASVVLFVLNALTVSTIGYFVLRQGLGHLAGEAWLAVLAIVHVAVGLAHPRASRLSPGVRRLALVLGVILGDLAFGLTAPGVVLAFGWAGLSVLFAVLRRRSPALCRDSQLVDAGLGAHVTLVLLHALAAAPLQSLGQGGSLPAILAVCALAAAAFTSARLLPEPARAWRAGLDALSLAAVAYLSAVTLSGPALVLAWTGEALTLAQLTRRNRSPFTLVAAGCFLLGGALLTLTGAARPRALLYGTDDLGAAALSLGAIAATCAVLGRAVLVVPWLRLGGAALAPARVRTGLLVAGGVALLLLASVSLVSAFQPAPGQVLAAVADLSVRQQGQVLLSALWSLVGLSALIAGLRARLVALRSVALALLLITTGKVFLFDLSTLDSIYRVASFVVLGVLLLTGAYAWQRLRPDRASDSGNGPATAT